MSKVFFDVESALQQSRAAAGSKDIRIGVDPRRVSVRIADAVASPHCTHVRYEMQRE